MLKKIKLVLFFFTLFFLIFSLNLEFGSAESTSQAAGGQPPVSLSDPLGLTGENRIQILIGKVISAALGIVGSLALLMFIYGGLVWMTSAGNNEKVEKGKNILIWATVGLIVIFTSYTLVDFILKVF
jgi:hypothetical protein